MAMPLFESALAAGAQFLVLMMSADDVLRRGSSQLLTGTQPWTIFERALTLLVKELHKTKHALVDHPRVTSPRDGVGRHIPASVKREVWKRDRGQCAFAGALGRCTERGFLEYHHRIPFSDGGATNLENLELR